MFLNLRSQDLKPDLGFVSVQKQINTLHYLLNQTKWRGLLNSDKFNLAIFTPYPQQFAKYILKTFTEVGLDVLFIRKYLWYLAVMSL